MLINKNLDHMISVSSPVIVATGTGVVGEGLRNTWGSEDEDMAFGGVEPKKKGQF